MSAPHACPQSEGFASAVITIEKDGSIVALLGLTRDDADSVAAIAAVLAEELRTSPDRIHDGRVITLDGRAMTYRELSRL